MCDMGKVKEQKTELQLVEEIAQLDHEINDLMNHIAGVHTESNELGKDPESTATEIGLDEASLAVFGSNLDHKRAQLAETEAQLTKIRAVKKKAA